MMLRMMMTRKIAQKIYPIGILYPPDQKQDDQNDDHEAQSTAAVISGAVERPTSDTGKSTEQKDDENDQDDGHGIYPYE
jgi:hypothetical protein